MGQVNVKVDGDVFLRRFIKVYFRILMKKKYMIKDYFAFNSNP